MAVYFIISYDIVDFEEFQHYPPKVMELLKGYNASVLVSDTAAVAVEGESKTMNAIIQFPSMESALQCYRSQEYEEIKKIRHRSTTNCTIVIGREFEFEASPR